MSADGFVDLHLHTCHSDGSDPAAEVVRRAAALGLRAIAITDHDTTAAVPKARAACAELGLEFLAGTEISTWWNGRELHILGYGIREDDPGLTAALAGLREARARRAHDIVARLCELGLALPETTPWPADARDSAGRMHVARWLRDLGITRTTQEGFDRYLNPGRPAFVPKALIPAAEAIAHIHTAGGLAFLAHPGLGGFSHAALDRLLALPFDGIEAWHIAHKPEQADHYRALAAARGLLVSGGSDCHGTLKGMPEMGKVRVPYAVYEAIAARLAAKATA